MKHSEQPQWRRGRNALQPKAKQALAPNKSEPLVLKPLTLEETPNVLDTKESPKEEPQENKSRTKEKKKVLKEEIVTEAQIVEPVLQEEEKEVKDGDD